VIKSAIVDHGLEYPCACAVYNVSAIVGLSPVRTFILDGGENILEEFQSFFVNQMKPPVQGSQLRCLTMLHKMHCVS
jgi:hypothetical protein